VRLLARAKSEEDWELCKELVRFLTALDESGATLREALEMVNLRSPKGEQTGSSFLFDGSRLKVPRSGKNGSPGTYNGSSYGYDRRSRSSSRSPTRTPVIDEAINGRGTPQDYFSSQMT
jgi:RAB6A-GEF complex partner protein 1